MEEQQESISPWVRTRYDEENQRWMWRVATSSEIAEAKAAGEAVHKYHMKLEKA